MMVAAGDKLLQAERQRIEQQGEGPTATDKARRLEQLRHQILRLCARRELALRKVERDGEFLPRPAVHPELVVARRPDLEQLVTG
jgi:hypothetical protein